MDALVLLFMDALVLLFMDALPLMGALLLFMVLSPCSLSPFLFLLSLSLLRPFMDALLLFMDALVLLFMEALLLLFMEALVLFITAMLPKRVWY
eukprot:2144184-Rhodomonas_salina.1